MPDPTEYSFVFLPDGAEPAAAELVEEVFHLQVAPHFSREGISEFLRYTPARAIRERLDGHNFMLAAYGQEGLAGVMEADCEREHIVLFFVRPEAQGRGLGRALLGKVLAELKRRKPGLAKVTVNSSPNAVVTYLSLGFTSTDHQQEHNGIRFTPMELSLG